MLTPEEWCIDGEHSTLRFWLRHIVVQQIHGHFRAWGGRVLADPRTPSLSTVVVWIDLASIDTGEPERDEQLRSAEFFDVARFPRARFVSTAVRAQARANPVVVGRLDLHGIEREVEIEVSGQEDRIDDSGVERRTYSISAEIDRRAFGLRWNQDLDVGGVVVGDKVEIRGRIETVRIETVRREALPVAIASAR